MLTASYRKFGMLLWIQYSLSDQYNIAELSTYIRRYIYKTYNDANNMMGVDSMNIFLSVSVITLQNRLAS